MRKGLSLNFLVMILSLLLMILAVSFHSGVKEGYMNLFVIFVLMVPLILTAWRKGSLVQDLAAAILSALFIALALDLFWAYQDSRDFYFSFENTIKWQWMGVASGLAFLVGIAIRWISSMIWAARKSRGVC